MMFDCNVDVPALPLIRSSAWLGIVNNQNAMNRKYLVAIKVNADNGSIVEGNSGFDTDEPLTARHLEIVKERYCSDVTAKGVKCSPEKAVVYAVIPLDA